MMEDSSSTSRNLVLERNIFYNNTGERDSVIYWFNQWKDDRVKASDHNLLYNSNGQYITAWCPGRTIDWNTWKTVFKNKFDRNSRIADPMFVDPANGDFRFRSGSPAPSLGIEEIDSASIGLTPDFRFHQAPAPPSSGSSADGGSGGVVGTPQHGGWEGSEPVASASSAGGCTLNPKAAFGIEWLLVSMAMVLWRVRRRLAGN
jgi:hypothetical protein